MSGRPSRSENRRGDSPFGHRSRSRECRRGPRSRHDGARGRRRRDSSYSSRDGSRNRALDTILGRLTAIEGRLSASTTSAIGSCPTPIPPTRDRQTPPLPVASGETNFISSEPSSGATDKLVGALTSLLQARPSHYYISSFDPNVHDFDAWCAEVDRGRELNRWADHECLSRIGSCLKGDARTWLSDWTSNDRTWTNFKSDFHSLCPRSIDIANILYDVMSTSSNKFPTYAEYARKSLLRLKIVKGLSDDLITAIVIRGLTDPQVKAAASNAKLQCNELVEFLSVYSKPKNDFRDTRNLVRSSNERPNGLRKRGAVNNDWKCSLCGGTGHKHWNCPKKQKTETNNATVTSAAGNGPLLSCTYCGKAGHSIDRCFVKRRVETNNKSTSNVNFCQNNNISQQSNVMTAVIEKVPVDVLIDSGSDISLISTSVLKHLKCNRKPTFRLMRGIGSQEIESTSYVTTLVELPEISLEVDLYVVPSDSIGAPVLLGTDVLNREGVTYVRTGDTQSLTRVEKVSQVHHLRALDTVAINTPLVGEAKTTLLSLLNEYSDSFITGTATSTVNTGYMEIKLNSDAPVHYRPYKLSANEKAGVRGIVNDLLSKGIIRESQSEYASPIILVKKKDGSDRMCVDYRALNAITIKDRFPLPLIDDHIDKLGSAKYFTSLDMATGFHQVPMKDDDSISKTAFVTPESQFEYLKMPYGLANAPVVYQRIISKTLKALIDTGRVLTYIDDVLILSDTVDDGLTMLRQVLTTLTAAGFSINLKKCAFLETEIEYLGRLISQGQVRPSPGKVDALVKSQKPTNVKQVRQFLGLAGYFRRYIANYATKTACIAKLTKKGEPFLWGREQDVARDYIISCLTEEPVLAIFDPKLPTELHTDASSIGYGGILLQEHDDKRKRVVSYFSRATHGAESRYHSYELETLAIVKALQHFRHYLIGIDFKILTDCNSLKLTQKKKDLIPRVARWWVYLQDFRFTIEYRKGAFMQHADFLSRNPVSVSHIRKPTNWAQMAQTADNETQELMEKVRDGQLDPSRYVVKNNLLYYKYSRTGEESRLLCFIPKGYRLSLLRVFHDDHEHIGMDKTTELILRHFWFPGLRQFIKKYINHCVICLSQKRVPRASHQPIQSWTKPESPFSTVHMDVLGPLPESNGFKYVLVLVDAFSKFCLLYALHRQDTEDLKRVFINAISLFGTPSLIVTDRARMFESSAFQTWVTGLGCSTHLITPEMHQENGQAERYCRSVLNMLRIEANSKSSSWSEVLWKIQLTLNMTKQATTQTSPLHLLVGIEATTPVLRSLVRDVALDNSHANREALGVLRRQRATEQLQANQRRQDRYVNKSRVQPRVYAIGDYVFVSKFSQSTGKLDSGMRGPYKVVRQLPQHRYELELLAGSYGKKTQAAAEHLVLWRGEWTPETCAVFFETGEHQATLCEL